MIVEQFKNTIPRHQIKISQLGGASAGGMCATMMLLNAFEKHNPIEAVEQIQKNKPSGNSLFDSWVHMNNFNGQESIQQFLKTDDLASQGVSSLLNANIIDGIADCVFKNADGLKPSNIKPYFSSDLELMLTLCSLRALPLQIKFKAGLNTLKAPPAHIMKHHALKARFKLSECNTDEYFSIFKNLSLLKKCCVATGVFPFGLKARYFNEFSKKCVRNDLEQSLLQDIEFDIFFNDNENTSDFNFMAVDGGTLNNQSFNEVYHKVSKIAGNECFGSILINPFPNFEDEPESKNSINSVFELPIPLLKALRHQASFKYPALGNNGSRFSEYLHQFMIFPSKYSENENKEKKRVIPPMACDSLAAFGGFFDWNFRLHDYFLGRDNCKQFLRNHFVLPRDSKLFKDHDLSGNSPFIKRADDAKKGAFLPIIPDTKVISEKVDINQKVSVGKLYTIPKKPYYKVESIFELEDEFKNRLKELLKRSLDEVKNDANNNDLSMTKLANEIYFSYRPKNFFNRFVSRIRFYLVGGVTFPLKQLHLVGCCKVKVI